MKRRKCLVEAQDRYQADLKRVWISRELESILSGGQFGDTIIESSRALASFLRQQELA